MVGLAHSSFLLRNAPEKSVDFFNAVMRRVVGNSLRMTRGVVVIIIIIIVIIISPYMYPQQRL